MRVLSANETRIINFLYKNGQSKSTDFEHLIDTKEERDWALVSVLASSTRSEFIEPVEVKGLIEWRLTKSQSAYMERWQPLD